MSCERWKEAEKDMEFDGKYWLYSKNLAWDLDFCPFCGFVVDDGGCTNMSDETKEDK